MSAVATFGPPVRIDGPLPLAPTFSLLNTVQVLNEAISNDVESVSEVDGYLLRDSAEIFRWGNGAQVYPYPIDTGYSWDPCSTGTFAIKEAGQTPPLPVFSSFTAYLPETCTSSRIVNEDYFKARAQLAFAAVESGIYEHVLATGGALNGSGQPYLGDSNLTILGGGPVSAKEGLALLSDAIGGTFRRGMIHATPATVIAWSFFGEAIQQVGGRLISAGGNDVIQGDGYIGATPDGEGTPASDQAWAYATGPVQVRREPDIRIYPDFLYQALDRSENIVTYRAERDALVDWDTQLQVGVLIDRSLT